MSTATQTQTDPQAPQAPRFRVLRSTAAPLPVDHVDTDQIIPAEYLKTTSREGLGRGLFAGWRFRDGEAVADFVLNREEHKNAKILIAGENFGCGSSREHAPWALLDHGFRAVISSSFADIFRSNSLKNGLLPVEVPADVRDRLLAQAQENPNAEIEVDLEQCILTSPDGESISFSVDAFSRNCLLEGVDTMGYLLARVPEIEAWEQRTQADAPFVLNTQAAVGPTNAPADKPSAAFGGPAS